MTADDTHLPPQDLKYGKGTKVRWAAKPQNKLLVFVHGFYGSAVHTWEGFPEQLAIRPEIHGYDIVYFGYESSTQTAAESANQLQKCLDDLLASTGSTVNRSISDYDTKLRRDKVWTYKNVVLVGHSLGACVIRRAILNQIRAGKHPWGGVQIKMIWFAPAHSGARIFRLFTAATLGFSFRGVDIFASFLKPVLQDLSKNSSFLNALRAETANNNVQFPYLNAPLTFWAWKDKVVLNDAFEADATPYEEVRRVNHMTVCKPTGYDKRVSLLLKELP